jgi:choline dehydrogenase-like flavoprotein
MSRILIVGAGPAAAGAALALAEDPAQDITILDVGTRLEAVRAEAVARLGQSRPGEWDAADEAMVSVQPVAASTGGLPQKRSYGSDYPFRDVGQVTGILGTGGANTSVVSGAYGGFSNVWGAQVMPYTTDTLASWPIPSGQLQQHYKAILSHIPFAAENDDLEALFPLYGRPTPLPPLAARTRHTLARYDRFRTRINAVGVTVGRARLAFDAEACIRCGLCMTGCPYGLIYSASHTLDELLRRRRVSYLPGLLALRVFDTPSGASLEAKELATGRMRRFEADRVLLACGALGTTRVVVNSLRRFEEDVKVRESVQFVIPTISRRPVEDPRSAADFTLNQFNVVVAAGDHDRDLAQIHYYPYNPAVLAGLPRWFRGRLAAPATTQLLRRVSIGLGYLPSWASPSLTLRATIAPSADRLPLVALSGDHPAFLANPMFRTVLRRMMSAGIHLDLLPVIPMTSFSAPGKSYHWGGTFPHVRQPSLERNATDPLGRIPGWHRVHLIDASVFPSVAATTFTLTIMANAHRIASEVRAL